MFLKEYQVQIPREARGRVNINFSARMEPEMHHLRDFNGNELPMTLVSCVTLLARNLATDCPYLILLGNILKVQSVNAVFLLPPRLKLPNCQAY